MFHGKSIWKAVKLFLLNHFNDCIKSTCNIRACNIITATSNNVLDVFQNLKSIVSVLFNNVSHDCTNVAFSIAPVFRRCKTNRIKTGLYSLFDVWNVMVGLISEAVIISPRSVKNRPKIIRIRFT